MILHICCNLAGSTVFPQMFEALAGEGLEQIVFVPEKRKRDMGKNLPEGVETHYVRTVRKLDTIFFSRKAKHFWRLDRPFRRRKRPRKSG